ncbi:hypothetical protein K1719_034149 [Acacia pycnantha]|nr:hypothetical protein K1719_034149 [Acacia pycnantha]
MADETSSPSATQKGNNIGTWLVSAAVLKDFSASPRSKRSKSHGKSRRKCRESARGINDFDLEIGVFLWAEKNPKCGDMTTGRSNKSKTNYSFNCRLRV